MPMNKKVPFHLEPFELRYLDGVLQLFHDTVHAINAQDYSVEQINAWAPENIDRDRWVKRLTSTIAIIAKEGDNVVGFGDATVDGSIEHLYTHKDYQGYGIGSAMLHQLENLLRAQGVGQVNTEASITAKPFFERQGYQVVKSQDMLHRSGVTFRNFVMIKQL